MQSISERISSDEYRPAWVPASTPKCAQADQFLNAYYYQRVGGTTQGVHDFHDQNKDDIEAALVAAMAWWKRCNPEDVAAERETLLHWVPFLTRQFERNTLLNLTADQFAEVCLHVHAMIEYARQVPYEAIASTSNGGGTIRPD